MNWSRQTAATGTTPWCLGVESVAASGWVGTDWIENILLRQSGAKKYDDWYNGKLGWTSPEVKSAFQAFGAVATDPKMVYGGPTTVLTTNFGDAATPMFAAKPGCFLHHQATFISSFFEKNTPGIKAVTDIPVAQLFFCVAQGNVRIRVPERRIARHGLLSTGVADFGSGVGVPGDLSVHVGLERFARGLDLSRRTPDGRADDGGDQQLGQSIRRGLATAHGSRVHFDAVAAARVFHDATLFRARHSGRVGQGMTRAAW
jgi:hypothetical protein